MKTLHTSLLTVALLLGAPAALAQGQETTEYPECSREPTDSDLSAAKGAFQAGDVSYKEADYERAIMFWEDAFRRDCTATALLLNLSRAYELAGNRPQAVVALRAFLDREPDSSERPALERRLEVLSKQIEANKPPPPQEPEPETDLEATPPSAGLEDGSSNASAEASADSSSLPIGPLIVGGVGVVATALGGYWYIQGSSDYSDAEAQCPNHSCSAPAVIKLGNDARDTQNRGGWTAGIGVGLMAVGGVWWYLSSDSDEASSAAKGIELPVGDTRLNAQASHDYAGLSLSGTF